VSRVRIGDVRADYAVGRRAGAAHTIARGVVILTRGDLSRVDCGGAAPLENSSSVEGRRRRCRCAWRDWMVHAESTAAQTAV